MVSGTQIISILSPQTPTKSNLASAQTTWNNYYPNARPATNFESGSSGGGNAPASSQTQTPVQAVQPQAQQKPTATQLEQSGFSKYSGPSANNFAVGGYVVGKGFNPMFGETTSVYLPSSGLTYELNRYGQSMGASDQEWQMKSTEPAAKSTVMWGKNVGPGTSNPLSLALGSIPRKETYTTTTSKEGFVSLSGPGYPTGGLTIGVNKDVFANSQKQQDFWASTASVAADNKASYLWRYEQGAKYFEAKTTEKFGPIAGSLAGYSFGANLPGKVAGLGLDVFSQTQKGNWLPAAELGAVGLVAIGIQAAASKFGLNQWVAPAGFAVASSASDFVRGNSLAYSLGSGVSVLGAAKVYQTMKSSSEQLVNYKPSEIQVTKVQPMGETTRVYARFEPLTPGAGKYEVGGEGFLDLTAKEGKVSGSGWVSGQSLTRSTSGGLFSPSQTNFKVSPSVAKVNVIGLGESPEVTLVDQKAGVFSLPAREKFFSFGSGASSSAYTFTGKSAVTPLPDEGSFFVDVSKFISKGGSTKIYSSGQISDLTAPVGKEAGIQYLPTPTQSIGFDGGTQLIQIGKQSISTSQIGGAFASAATKLFTPSVSYAKTIAIVIPTSRQADFDGTATIAKTTTLTRTSTRSTPFSIQRGAMFSLQPIQPSAFSFTPAASTTPKLTPTSISIPRTITTTPSFTIPNMSGPLPPMAPSSLFKLPDLGGGGFNQRKWRGLVGGSQKRGYNPSLTALAFNIRTKTPLKKLRRMSFTGLDIRPVSLA